MPIVSKKYEYTLKPKRAAVKNLTALAGLLHLPYEMVQAIFAGRTAPGAPFIAHLEMFTNFKVSDLFEVVPLRPVQSRATEILAEAAVEKAPTGVPAEETRLEPWVSREPDLEPAHTGVAWEWWAYRDALRHGKFKRAGAHRATAEGAALDWTADQVADRAAEVAARLKLGKKVKPV